MRRLALMRLITVAAVAVIAAASNVACTGTPRDDASSSETAKPAGIETLERIAGAQPRNVVFVLADDHRYDAMSFMGHPIVETPNMDRVARNGVHMKNAFVTTALCSPSRATLLTGRYAHQHRVVDNNNPVPPGTTFFPQYLQRAGYQTAFIGKWHMGGEGDDPQPGFDRWVSFRGQGSYMPSNDGLNVDGTRVPQKGYISDELTDYAIDWLRARDKDRPFFLYLSHKGVHANFIPAERHAGRFASRTFRRGRQPRPRARSPRIRRPGRIDARHLHGRQRLRVRRARPHRQAHGIRGVDARADGHAVSGAVRRRTHD